MEDELKLKSIYDKYCENKNSHVYLVQTDSIEDALEDVKKLIIAINQHNNIDVSKLIESNNLPTLIVVKPDKNEIKTEDSEKLIGFLQKIPVITRENFFIVVNAEKLNEKSGNQLLKIIEEPDTEALGFFICLNSENVLPTIRSRLQFTQIYYNKEISFSDKIKDSVIIYLDMIHSKVDLSVNKMIVDKFKEGSEFNNFLCCLVEQEKKYINEQTDFDIIKKESLILKKIYELEEKIHNNANVNLMLDRFLLEVGRL